MSDLISRAAAIEYLMTNMGWHDEDGYEVDDADEKRKVITDLVNGIPAVDAIPVVHGRWIDTKDRLPADRGRYLVMLKTDGKIGFDVHEHLIRILYFGSEGWRLPRHFPEWIHEQLKQEVTHWMPLPEPPKMDGESQ